MRLPRFRTYLFVTLGLLGVEVLSYLGFVMPNVGTLSLVMAVIATAWLAWQRLEIGIAILFAELFIGGKGYLLSAQFGEGRLSIRIALFVAVIAIWLLRHRGNGNPLNRIPLDVKKWLIFLGIVVVWGVLFGLINQRGLGPVYFDANAFLFFLLAPVLFSPAINWPRFSASVIAVLAAATTILGLKSLVSLGIFAHLDPDQLRTYYRWIRTTGVGEIAYINGNAYRVFFQSQIFGLFGALVLGAALLPSRDRFKRAWWLLAPITLGAAAVLISLSRSFWLGTAAALLAAASLGWIRWRWTIRQFFIAALMTMATLGAAYTLTSWALNFPYPFPPSRDSQAAKLIGQRFETLGGEAAASSRLNQLEPLRTGILRSPAFGSGFGTPLTYLSNDPRQLASPGRGIFTTYAFEWGYLDLLLKVGLIGLVMYLGLLWSVGRGLWQAQTRLGFGLLTALIALVVIHVTTPYLNHPLGIGLVLLSLSLGRTRL